MIGDDGNKDETDLDEVDDEIEEAVVGGEVLVLPLVKEFSHALHEKIFILILFFSIYF